MFNHTAGLIFLGALHVISHDTCNETLSKKVMRLLTLCSSNDPTCRTGNPLNREFVELGDGWVSPFNGYQYKYVAIGNQNWTTARATCHNVGGDSASFGIRNIETRRILKEALNFGFVWIGLNYISSEGTWRYIASYPSNDGDLASNSTALWGPYQPYNYTYNNCAYMDHFNLLSYSLYCSDGYINLHIFCEKPV